MAETNKILEVTYGEFSCRLEGFEDAVETMKTVVAYFHELSGHDQFMDMRPLAPDVATLARLTEEQTGGSVDVENTPDGISLRVQRQADTVVPDEAMADMDASDTMLADEVAGIDTDDDNVDEDMISDDAADLVAERSEDDVEESADAENVAQNDDEFLFAEDDKAPEDMDDVTLDTPAEPETSVADKLQRIRAVVGRGSPSTSETYAEDINEAETEAAPKSANPLAQRLAELAKRNSELMDADNLAQEPQMEYVTPLDQSAEDEIEADEIEADGDFGIEETVDTADLDSVIADDVEDEPVAADATPVAEDVSENDIYETPDAPLTAEAAVVESDEIDADTAEAPSQQIEPELEQDDADTAGSSQVATKITDKQPLLLTTPHSKIPDAVEEEDDEFDLKAELAEIEREIAARPGNEVARHGLPRSVEDAMSRILNETNEQLNEPEGRRHRDAFAQLKAAVAATEASRQLGDLAKSRDISAQFRDDLGALDAEGKAKGEGLPPLKLVTPVKDDEKIVTPSKPVQAAPNAPPKPLDAASERLRQIAATVASRDASEDTNFAAFAQEHGANDLADMLEAAAAYIAYVEGENDFSRPQVMKVVQSASPEEISREDGLRSFGRLLRQSRIIKLNNGRFQVSEDTRFRPDTNRAARG